MMKTLASAILLFTIVLSAVAAEAMTSDGHDVKVLHPEVRDMCAGATWPAIPALCLQGGNGHEVRYAGADAQIASDFADRFNAAF